MGKKISLKEKIIKMYKKNDTAGLIYITFLQNKNDEEKKEAIDIFIELAKVDNEDKLLRAKAVAILGFFKNMSCGEKIEEFYKDGSIICDYKNIPGVIEDNCKEIIKILEQSVKIDLNVDFEFYHILCQVIICLNAYEINHNIVSRLIDLLQKKTNLSKEAKSESMTERDLHISGQILRIRKNLIKKIGSS